MAVSSVDIEAMIEETKAATARIAVAAKTIKAQTVNPGVVIISAEGLAPREVQIGGRNVAKAFFRLHHDLLRQATATSFPLSGRVSTKLRAKTIGVNAKNTFWRAVFDLAEQRDEKLSVIYRELLLSGLKELDKRLDNEAPSKVFGDFSASLDDFDDSEKQQRSVRIEQDFYNRAIFIAKEFGKSLSEVAALCMASGLRSRSSEPTSLAAS